MAPRPIDFAEVDAAGRSRAGGVGKVRHHVCACLADRRGASAVEFAIVSLPFLLLVFAIIELSLVFITGLCLSNAMATEARQIRVGALQAPGISASASSGIQIDLPDFKTAVCNQIPLLPTATCVSQLQVDVRTLNAFNASATPSPISGGTFSTSGLCFYSGGAGSIVEVRAYYLWPLVTPLLLSPLANVTSLSSGGSSTSGSWMIVSDNEVMKTESAPGDVNTGAGC